MPGDRDDAEVGGRGDQWCGGRRGHEPRAWLRSAGRLGRCDFFASFAQLGLYPDFGATYFLPRLVGLSRASELFYTGETLTAQEACHIGIVYQVFAPDKFEEETAKLAEHLAAGPPLAYRDVKRTMIGDKKREMEDALDEEIRLQSHCFTTEDCAEGLAAFFEKRKPNFRGF